jgi:hypothetical protein
LTVRGCTRTGGSKKTEQEDLTGKETTGANDIFIGEIGEVYAEDDHLTDGLPDIKKVDPIVFSMRDNTHGKVGDHIGRAWHIGRELKPGTEEKGGRLSWSRSRQNSFLRSGRISSAASFMTSRSPCGCTISTPLRSSM